MRVLLKLLFPSWDFFKEYGAHPRVFVRGSQSGGTASSEWKQILQANPSNQRWWQVFVNSEENLRLAKLSVLLLLIDDLNEWKGDRVKIKALKSYQSFSNICSIEFRKLFPGQKYFEFKISELSQSETIDVFLSSSEELVWR